MVDHVSNNETDVRTFHDGDAEVAKAFVVVCV